MSDLTPVLLSPPATSAHYFAEALEALKEGVKRWTEATEGRNVLLGEFFYNAACNVMAQDYKTLMKTAVAGFNVGEDTIGRYRTLYQRSNALPPPTRKSAAQQKRAIEAPASARPRATEPPPSGGSDGLGAGEDSAVLAGSGRTQTPAGSASTSASAAGSPALVLGRDSAGSNYQSAANSDQVGSSQDVGPEGHGAQGEPGDGVALNPHETPLRSTPSPEASNKAQVGPPPSSPSARPSTSGSSRPAGASIPPLDAPPAGPSLVLPAYPLAEDILRVVTWLSSRGRDYFAKVPRKALQDLGFEIDAALALTVTQPGRPVSNGSLHRAEVAVFNKKGR